MKYNNLKPGDIVTPDTKRSVFYGQKGKVVSIDDDGEGCYVLYPGNPRPHVHFQWPIVLVEESIVDKVLNKYL